jgi:uncharacterized protein (DUF1810 family)
MEDHFNLERFVAAQRDEIDSVYAELKSGYKSGHWMWFIFPQLKGLGKSWMANQYAISGRAEAEAYIAHLVLGPRLVSCTELVNLIDGRSATDIFGDIDSLKFRSSITLFDAVSSGRTAFALALDKYFGGEPDRRTLDLLDAP